MSPTLLPAPVAPATITCGIDARSAKKGAPTMSRPSTTGSGACQLREALVLDELAQDHRHALLVRDLEADAVLAGDGRDDAHLARKPEREIVGERRDLGDLGAGLRATPRTS